jgi:hypothetical protein
LSSLLLIACHSHLQCFADDSNARNSSDDAGQHTEVGA